MTNLFDAADYAAILGRLDALQPDATRQWGKMNPAQMLAHCANAAEAATGERVLKRGLLGRILGPLVRKMVLGSKPFQQNGPTDKAFVITEPREFDAERHRLRGCLERLYQGGPEQAARHEHVFFGKFTGEEWGILMHKHLDHHLRQFGA